MARHMGCSIDAVNGWESGDSRPDPETLYELEFLVECVHDISERVLTMPIAEQVMDSDHLSQLTHRDLLDRNQ